MGTKLFIGNLPFSVDDEALSKLFSKIGTVKSAKVIIDRYTEKSRGFAFIEMETEEEASKAISDLNGTEIDGRQINVSEAKPRKEGSGFGGNHNNSGRRNF